MQPHKTQEKLVFFDTETTGLPRNGASWEQDYATFPYLTQVAWVVIEDDGTILIEHNYIIRPNGWGIPPAATAIHGISQERAVNEGMDLKTVLSHFILDTTNATRLVAHNIHFDTSIIKANLLRLDFNKQFFCDALDKEKRFDTMMKGMACMKTNKWPKLAEMYRHLFHEEIENAHDALADVRACMRCYFKIV